MAFPLRLLDRMVLGAAWPALAAAVAAAGLGWLLRGPAFGLAAGPYGIALGLAVAYGTLVRDGEYAALLRAGIAPRRVGAAVVVSATALALGEAAIACAFFPPAVRAGYAGYVLAALQLPLIASLVLPITVRSRNDEPWARVVLLLFAYTIATVVLTALGRSAGWAPGSEWCFADVALATVDIVLYRAAARPSSHL